MLYPYKLNLKNDETKILAVAKALSSPVRIEILKLLLFSSMNIKQIAQALNQPLSSTAINLQMLEDAGLIFSKTTYNSQGKMRICARQYDQIEFTLFDQEEESNLKDEQKLEIELPVGSYFDYENITAPCGMAGSNGKLDVDDNPDVFFSTKRHDAQLIWFSSGALEYRIPVPKTDRIIKRFELSFEACSEAPLYNNNYKSDISVWINQSEIGTWCSPGDFGGRQGQFTPSYWPSTHTQYGQLNTWIVTESGTTMNNEFISYTSLKNCKLDKENISSLPYISIKLGVKEDALHRGGFNLFGKGFGDYAQHIVVRIIYE
jgi:predicted transcriptional regulator